ncbi:hypothetical protein NQ318_011773 [Aromia moschata]|uniref:Uncharacterized protein n=1 Tax=Aromia moschata TaxID=1265417 RepID=A0AAV8XZE7_9CUCU|nr:hypothetical protein NQ318_011773 [Aromia moschata]
MKNGSSHTFKNLRQQDFTRYDTKISPFDATIFSNLLGMEAINVLISYEFTSSSQAFSILSQSLLDTLTLKETRFESVEAVKAKATEVLNQLTEADFHHCFNNGNVVWSGVEIAKGEYIEGEKVATVIEERETTEDDPRPGRPSISKTDEIIEKIEYSLKGHKKYIGEKSHYYADAGKAGSICSSNLISTAMFGWWKHLAIDSESCTCYIEFIKIIQLSSTLHTAFFWR